MVQQDFNFYPGLFKRGKEYDTFVESVKNKNPIISDAQNHKVLKMIDSYKKLKPAAQLITGGFSEQTICGTLHDVLIKVRFDYINVDKGYIADVKTTSYGSDIDSFKMTMDGLMYQLSAALYCQMAEQYYGKPFDFYFVVLSKKDSTCNVYKTSAATMDSGKRIVLEACNKYKTAKETNNWTDQTVTATLVKDTDYEIQEV